MEQRKTIPKRFADSFEGAAVPHSKALNTTNTEHTECTDKSKTSRNTQKLIKKNFIE